MAPRTTSLAGKLLLCAAALGSLTVVSCDDGGEESGFDWRAPPLSDMTSNCSPEKSCPKPDFNQPGTCCREGPGGMLMFVQLWDTEPRTGPEDSWTIHGLWPSHCDGEFRPGELECCNSSQWKVSPREVLNNASRHDLIKAMDEVWMDNRQQRDHFWNHEWATHGTCVSTLKDSCLRDSRPGTGLVRYFERIVNLFGEWPTYKLLEASSPPIRPSYDVQYPLSDLKAAIRAGKPDYDFDVTFTCNKQGAISAINYYFNLEGSLADGKLIPIRPPQASLNEEKCPKYVTYKPKPSGPIPPEPEKKQPYKHCTPPNEHSNRLHDNHHYQLGYRDS